MSSPTLPKIEIFSHTECPEIDLDQLAKRALVALPLCLKARGQEDPLLGDLEEIEISLVSDEVIAGVHGEFMDDPTPTDVITFHHGEILLSTDTARRAAPAHGNSMENETLLYLIHGLLHLNGHTDLHEPDRTEMHQIQEEILRAVATLPTEHLR